MTLRNVLGSGSAKKLLVRSVAPDGSFAVGSERVLTLKPPFVLFPYMWVNWNRKFPAMRISDRDV